MESTDIEHTEIKWTPPEYTCEKHGDVGTNVVKFSLPNSVERNFCMYCIQELIMDHCTEVKEKSDESI